MMLSPGSSRNSYSTGAQSVRQSVELLAVEMLKEMEKISVTKKETDSSLQETGSIESKQNKQKGFPSLKRIISGKK